MRIAPFFALAFAALAVSAVACGGTASNDDNAVTPTDDETGGDDELKALSVTEADSGKTVTITKGQNLLVKLKSNPTTGYKWSVTATDRTFGYPAYERFIKNGDAVGSGGIQRFTWKTNGPLDVTGEHTLRLEYKRDFEKDKPAAQTFEVTVKVVSGQCPELVPPGPGFCEDGKIIPKKDANGCTTGFDCQRDCRSDGCGDGRFCSFCWGSFACIPKGAMC